MVKENKPNLTVVQISKAKKTTNKTYKRKDHITLNFQENGNESATAITNIDYYMEKDPNRLLTPDDAAVLLAHICSKRSLTRYRKFYHESGIEQGPQFDVYLTRLVKYKVVYLYNFINQKPWIKNQKENIHNLSTPAVSS